MEVLQSMRSSIGKVRLPLIQALWLVSCAGSGASEELVFSGAPLPASDP
jgi:hypothetical protein